MRFSPALKAFAVVFGLVIVLGIAWFQYSEFLSQGQRPPDAALKLNIIEKSGPPEFDLQTLAGEKISLAKFSGKLIVLNFWASWCDPCVAEFPSLLKLVEKFNGDIILIAISADYEERDIHTFLKSFKITSPNVYIAWDKDYEVAKKYGTDKLPESYIIGRNGRLIRKVAGVDDWSSPEAFDFFADLLKR